MGDDTFPRVGFHSKCRPVCYLGEHPKPPLTQRRVSVLQRRKQRLSNGKTPTHSQVTTAELACSEHDADTGSDIHPLASPDTPNLPPLWLETVLQQRPAQASLPVRQQRTQFPPRQPSPQRHFSREVPRGPGASEDPEWTGAVSCSGHTHTLTHIHSHTHSHTDTHSH